MRARVAGFGRFVWDFVVGDDWRLAVGALGALGCTALVADTGVSAWWIAPAVVVVTLVGVVAHTVTRR